MCKPFLDDFSVLAAYMSDGLNSPHEFGPLLYPSVRSAGEGADGPLMSAL